MAKINNLKSPRFPEDSENESEIFYLLNFFSRNLAEQWSTVPKNFIPVWVETPHFHCNIHSPILFLTAMLTRVLDDIVLKHDRSYDFNRDTIILFKEEIYPLLVEWILKADSYNNDLIFENQEEITESTKIWFVLRRLCQIALSFEDWSKYEIKDLSFEFFLENHSYPFDPL
jgi:hypothetical protein